MDYGCGYSFKRRRLGGVGVAIALVLLVGLVAAACGGGGAISQGRVTDKIAPKGSTLCSGPLATSCGNDSSYRIVIEDFNPKHGLEANWNVGYATVCVPPSVFRHIHIGQWVVLDGSGRYDLFCS